MPCERAIVFRDIVGKLDVLNVECEKCGRRGRYHLDRLIERYGIEAKLFDWTDEITADCPRKQAMNLNDIAGRDVLIFPKWCDCADPLGRAPRSHFPTPRSAPS
jgi:hypothetical protein